jgi:flagellar hook protein FlgE
MSIYGAMFSGVSGMNANSQALGMISDNISNLNTIGYKVTDPRFSTLVTNAGLVSKYSPGGVRSLPFQMIDHQGLLQASDSTTHIAISGSGMMVVGETPTPTGTDRFLFTRAGQFSVDKDGYLVNTGNYYLQGWPTTPIGDYDVDRDGIADVSPPDPTAMANLQPITVNALVGTAEPTSNVSLDLNLPATALVGDTEALTVRVYDSLGVAHNVNLEWQKTIASAPGVLSTWELSVTNITIASTGAASTTLAYPVLIDTIEFGGNGTPSTMLPIPLTILAGEWTTGAIPSTIAFDLGTVGAVDGVTQFASGYSLNYVNVDGSGFGRFQSLEITDEGLVSALFDNGGRRAIYRLPIATFANPNAMSSVSGNAWSETSESGDPFLVEAGQGAAGLYSPSTLEASTVDLGHEFTNMIITQRAFSANTRVITTADEMLEELVRIKR